MMFDTSLTFLMPAAVVLTLGKLLLFVAIASIILTAVTYFGLNKRKSLLMSYVQNFCGALFLFSGWVKAVDPLGTAYKLEQYFEQFEYVFEPTWFGFLAPLFPIFSKYAITLSVGTIIFEIILGLMLILGHRPKFTGWAFFLLMLFFTFLTGFTYLTGYVPGDGEFFKFSTWGAYDANNMKVTDCGCFGDFIKLEPKTSFLKDVFLMIPAFFFLFGRKQMHELFGRRTRDMITGLALAGLVYFCMSNYVWDIPDNDFRPFKKGRNIAEQKRLEEEAMANVQITAYDVTNKASGEHKRLPYAEYIKNYKDYPSAEWDLKQITTEPTVAHSKISEFDVMDENGDIINDEILASDGPIIFLISHKMYGDATPSTRIIKDTIYATDTIMKLGGAIDIVQSIARVDERTEPYTDYQWKDFYVQRYKEVVLPFVDAAKLDGVPTIAVFGDGFDKIKDLSSDIGLQASQLGEADNILLKTIVRSNPGIVLMDKGVLVDKWHYKQLPDWEMVKKNYSL